MPWKRRAGQPLLPVPRGNYGIVRITRGQYARHLGFYDDDEVNGTSIVYPWGSAPAGYVVVRHSSLAKATDAEARLWDGVNENRFAQRSGGRSTQRSTCDMGAAPQHRRGVAGAVLAAARTSGFALGTAVAGAIYAARPAALRSIAPGAVAASVHACLFVVASVAAFAALLSSMRGA